MEDLVERYQRYWAAAAGDFPCLIVGMGRWGRVLAGVAFDARGGGAGIHLLARSNGAETAGWAATRLPGATVHASFEQLLAPQLVASAAERGLAIVASDPSRHRADWQLLNALGLPVLVEKPLAADLADVAAIAAAAGKRPVTGVGIEFSMLPVWPFIRSRLRAPVDEMVLTWEDPADEVRFGQVKRRHDGVSMAADLSYHVASISRHFCSIERARVTAIAANAPEWASLDLETPEMPRLHLDLSIAGSRRRRTLALRSGGDDWLVDFGGAVATVLRGGERVRLPAALEQLHSSLRLELGAFHLEARGGSQDAPIIEWLRACAAFHEIMAAALDAGAMPSA